MENLMTILLAILLSEGANRRVAESALKGRSALESKVTIGFIGPSRRKSQTLLAKRRPILAFAPGKGHHDPLLAAPC
jgi:hypothetical protein